MKQVSGTLKIGLAQYRDMQAFAMFASDLDATSRRQLERGARLTELLRQPQYSPFPVEDQVVSVWAGVNGQFDEVPVDDVLRFESELLEYLRNNTDVLTTIAETGKWDDDTANAVTKAIGQFKRQFRTSEGGSLVDGEYGHQPLEDDDITVETIEKQKQD